jgi:hypothetical protein
VVEMMGLEPTTPCLQSPPSRTKTNGDELLRLVRVVSVQWRITLNDGGRAIGARWNGESVARPPASALSVRLKATIWKTSEDAQGSELRRWVIGKMLDGSQWRHL